MIIFFHMAYVIATSLMNIITSSFFKADVAQQILNDAITEDERINEPVREQDSSAIHVHDEVCQRMQLVNGKSSGLGLHEEEQTPDDSVPSLRPRPYNIQGDGQSYAPTQPYVSANFENEDSDFNFRPIPPVYAQRYLAVKSVLLDEKWNGQIKKVIDFGCNDLAFFQYVKHMKGVEEVLLVDIDEVLLKKSTCRVAPLNCDYLVNRESPLLVQILCGTIAEQDSRLIGTDAVICIELIEHLWPNEVEAVPYTVFGFVLPKVAIFTTPNADFNVVFKNFSGFRHPDHKFEWTREQFECWANNIVQRYPAYEVTFHGIGAGPPSTEEYGCCSQMAVFVKRLTDKTQAEIEPGEVYKLICDYKYPFRVDNRTTKEKIRQEVEYYIHRYSKDEIHCVEDNIEIPLNILLPHVEMWCNSIGDLRNVLEDATWKISDRNPDVPAVIYPYYTAYSSSDEEDEERDTDSLLNEEKLIATEYLQSVEDWDQCDISPNSKAGSSSEQPHLNGWDEIYCLGETILWPLEVKKELVSFTENSRPPTTPLLPDTGIAQNSVKEIPVFKPNGSTWTFDIGKQVNGKGHEKVTVSTGVHAEVENLSNRLNSASGETVQVGTIFQSSAVNLVSEGNSAIAMAVKPSCARSLDDVALSLSTAAHVTDFLSELAGSAVRSDHNEVPEEFCASSVDGASTENHASGSLDLLQRERSASDSSRSFFLNLLTRERRALNGSEGGEQGMDLDQSPDADEEDYESLDSDDSLSGHSQDGQPVDNRRPAQPHRNHFPFGLNDAAVENGDVANNNRDGEGNNAVALEMPDDEDDLLDDEIGDHEEEDDDFDNANNLILPDHADPFPPWLLHLLQVANEDGIELGAAGEPHIFLGDL